MSVAGCRWQSRLSHLVTASKRWARWQISSAYCRLTIFLSHSCHYVPFSSSSCFLWHSFSIVFSLLPRFPRFLFVSVLFFRSSFSFTSPLLSYAILLSFLNFSHPLLFCHSSLSLSPTKSVMLKHQPDLCKSNTPLMSERGKRTTLFPQSGRTAFSTIVPTEVNYGWPSILHTLKRTASTGRKTLSIC